MFSTQLISLSFLINFRFLTEKPTTRLLSMWIPCTSNRVEEDPEIHNNLTAARRQAVPRDPQKKIWGKNALSAKTFR